MNHDVLMGRLAKRIGDCRMLGLIRHLGAGIMANGVAAERHEGTPQGGPLSPLMANVLLDEVDKELENRGHAFVRYADHRGRASSTTLPIRRRLPTVCFPRQRNAGPWSGAPCRSRRSTDVGSSELEETRTSDPPVPSQKRGLVDNAGRRNHFIRRIAFEIEPS